MNQFFVALIGVTMFAVGALPAQQPVRVSGMVVDRATGQGIGGAEIRLGDDVRVTSAEGRFQFGSVRPGSLELAVHAIGYGAEVSSLELVAGEDRAVTIALVAVPVGLDTIEITARRQITIDGPALVSRGPDLAAALDGWAGVVVTRTGAGNAAVPQIRGSAPEEVLVMIDGFMLNDPFTGRADLSRIATRDIDRLSLERGVQSARYGNRAIAGVINIETRRTPTPELSADFGSFESVAARTGASIGAISAAVTFDRLARDYAYQTPSGTEARRQNAGGHVYGLTGRISGPILVSIRGSLSERGLPGTTSNPTPHARTTDKSLFIGARRGSSNVVTASLGWLEARVSDSAPPPGFPAYDSRTEAWGGTLAFAANRRLHLGGWSGGYSAGGEIRYDRFSGDAVQTGADFGRSAIALNADLSRPVDQGAWALAPSIRLDWWSGESAPRASGRIEGHWSRNGTVLTAGFGNGVTVPVLADLLFREGVGVALNPDLRPERIRWEVEAGIRQQVRPLGIDGSVELNGFNGRVADMILWSASGPNLRTWRPDNFDVRRRGLEVSLEARSGRTLTLTGTTTLSDVKYDRPDGAQVRYRPRVSHAVFAAWSPGAWRGTVRWNRLGSRFTTASGLNPLPPIDLLNASLERGLGSTVTLRTEVRDLLDSRATYIAGYPSVGRTFHLSFNLELP